MHFDKLLGADTAYVFTVDLNIVRDHRSHMHNGKLRLRLRPVLDYQPCGYSTQGQHRKGYHECTFSYDKKLTDFFHYLEMLM